MLPSLRMDTKSILLNNKLAHASKKFYKSCEQIKLIKQKISELIGVYAYCDQEINRLSQIETNSSSNKENGGGGASIRSVQQHFEQEFSTTSTNNISSGSISSEYDDNNDNDDAMSKRLSSSSNKIAHFNVFREQIRQQIENLQSVKTAYFMYAHRKADEITKLQCELYGEDAVREAYEQAEPDVLLPMNGDVSTTTTNNANQQQQQHQLDEQQNNAFEIDIENRTNNESSNNNNSNNQVENVIDDFEADDEDDNDTHLHSPNDVNSNNRSVSSWNFGQYTGGVQPSEATNRPSNQFFEYEFLTA